MRNKTLNMDLFNFCKENGIRVTTYFRGFPSLIHLNTIYQIPYDTEFYYNGIYLIVNQKRCLKSGNKLIKELMNVFNIKEVTNNDFAK